MVTKLDAIDVNIDWDLVDRITEVRRTYLVRNSDGNEFFKMYKPSEAPGIFKRKGWVGHVVSTIDRSRLRRKT